MTAARKTPTGRRRRGSFGRILVGLFLILIGIGWLLDTSDIVTFQWPIVLSIALVLVGMLLLIGSTRDRSGGLVFLGIVLTVWLAVVPDSGPGVRDGLGDRVIRPDSIEELQDDYQIAGGDLVLDLTRIEFDRDAEVNAGVGAGDLLVLVPRDVDVEVEASAAAGEVVIFDRRRRSGLFLNEDLRDSDEGNTVRLTLDLSVGVGDIRVVRRG